MMRTTSSSVNQRCSSSGITGSLSFHPVVSTSFQLRIDLRIFTMLLTVFGARLLATRSLTQHWTACLFTCSNNKPLNRGAMCFPTVYPEVVFPLGLKHCSRASFHLAKAESKVGTAIACSKWSGVL